MVAAPAQPHISLEEVPFEELLPGYNDPGLSLDSLAAAHELTLRQLLAILNSEAFLTFLADLEQANSRRFAHIHAAAALNTLADVATSTAPPTERRRAATPLLYYLSRPPTPRFRVPPVPPTVGPPTIGAPQSRAPQPCELPVEPGATGQPSSAGPCPSVPQASTAPAAPPPKSPPPVPTPPSTHLTPAPSTQPAAAGDQPLAQGAARPGEPALGSRPPHTPTPKNPGALEEGEGPARPAHSLTQTPPRAPQPPRPQPTPFPTLESFCPRSPFALFTRAGGLPGP